MKRNLVRTARVSLAEFYEAHPECRNLSDALFACHASTVFHQTITTRAMQYARRVGYIVLRTLRAAKEYNEKEAKALYAKLYAILFERPAIDNKTRNVKRCKEHKDCFTGKRKGETVHIPRADVVRVPVLNKDGSQRKTNNGTLAYEYNVVENVRIASRVQYVASDKAEGEAVVKEDFTVIEQVEQGRVLGTVTKQLYSIFSRYSVGFTSLNGEQGASIGQRKGINSRLWFSAVQPQDIIQEIALELWLLVRDASPLLDNVDKLATVLVTAGKNRLLAALESPEYDADGELRISLEQPTDPKGIAYMGNKEQRLHWHRGDKRVSEETGKVSYRKRSMYRLGSLDDLRAMPDGTFSLLREYTEAE